MLRQQLQSVLQRIQQACERSGRPPSAVTLVAVTKGVAASRVQEAVALGISDLGENRVQEARDKRPAVQADGPRIRWHLIGHLQRNKTGPAAELFDVIHSIDSSELVDALERQAAGCGRTIEGLIQVNVSGEATKSGCRPEAAEQLAAALARSPHVRFAGLMTLAPFSDDPEHARPHFRALRALRDRLQSGTDTPLRLSMGMSHDFEVAIEEGADLVRIGTAIFGARDSGHTP